MNVPSTFDEWIICHLRSLEKLLLVALCLCGIGACHEKDTANPEKLPFDAEFEIWQSTCEGEACSSYSMRVYGDGTFDLKGNKCETAEPCRGTLRQEEVKKLFQKIQTFGFASFAAKPLKCERYALLRTAISMHLQWDGNEYEVDHNIHCQDSPIEAKLEQFESDISAILAIDQRVSHHDIARRGDSQAGFIDLESCKPKAFPKRSSRDENPSGIVRIKFDVGADGQLISSSIEKSSGYRDLDLFTLAELSSCRFKSGYRDGQAVASSFVTDYVWVPPD